MTVRAGLIAAAVAMGAGPAGAAECRLALAIGLDVSGSVDAAERALQTEGTAAALTSPDVEAALLLLPGAPVRIVIYEWSGPDAQRTLVPWTTAGSAEAIAGIAAALRGAERVPMPEATAVGSAMLHGAALLGDARGCWRLTLDLSGDGRSNAGPRPADVEVAAGGRAVTVNALVVGLPELTGAVPGLAELTSYFRREVLRGPDAFYEAAVGFADFEAAMRRKLVREAAVNTAMRAGRGDERFAGR